MSTYKLGLLLIDFSLDNIHNIVKNLKNNIYYIFIDNYDTDIITNKIKQLNITSFDFGGLLCTNYNSTNLVFNEIVFNKINNTNYFNYFNFHFNYIQQNININYNDTIVIDKPTITFLGGVFSIQAEIKSQIDKNTGQINIIADKIGSYNITITYTFANISFSDIINIISKPIILYNNSVFDMNYNQLLTIPKPEILPFIEGQFYCDTNLINIDKNNGIVTCNTNIISNNYTVYFTQNNIISNTQIKINVNSYIKYPNNYYEINYGDVFTSDSPNNYSNINGFYKVNNNLFTITVDGIINGKNLNVGIYDIIINYANYNTNIRVNVKPVFYYNNITELIYSNEGYSDLPIIKSNITNYYFELYESNVNISINKSTGKLYFSNKLLVNNYNIIVNLKINNNVCASTNFNLCVKPLINYNFTTIDYDLIDKLNKPVSFPLNGIFSCDNNIFNIDEKTGIISGNNKPDFGIYKILINYSYNSIINSTIVNIIVKPNIIYQYNKNIIYQTLTSLGTPSNNYNCIYSLKNNDDNITIDPITGEFKIIKCLPINYYNYPINIKSNNFIFEIYVDFYIIPTILYNINTINYNDIMLSDIPKVNPIGGTFNIVDDKLNLIISSNGQINFKNLNVGIYDFKVIYTYNNQNATFNYNITIKPSIKYNNLLPIINNPINGFYEIDKINNNFIIDKVTGKITIINKNIGIFNVDIKYTYNNISTIYNHIIEIKPELSYSNNNIIIYYTDNYTSELPNIIDKDGLFTINNNKNIIINENTGQFTVIDLLVNTYLFNVIYTKNNSSTILDFIIIVKPKVIYNNYLISFLQNFISDKPFINPEGGRFICSNSNINIDNYTVNIDNYTGIIKMNNLKVNNYSIPINYYYNNTYTIVNCNLTVQPILNYIYPKKSLIHNINEHGNNSFSPIINPIGGTFKINNNDITIDKDNGLINFSNFNLIGTFDIIINYIYNNVSTEFTYKFCKSPQINIDSYYEFEYNALINIPLNELNNNEVVYEIDNSNFSISDCNLMNNNIIDVGKYNINIKYTCNNLITTKLLTIIIKPIIKYDINNIVINDNNIFLSDLPIIEPLGKGEFTVNNKQIIIDNNGQITIDPTKCYLIDSLIVNYKINDIISTYSFNLTVKPYFKYNDNSITIPHNLDYYSEIPIVNRNDGIFSISNNFDNLISINNNGQLYFNKKLDFGSYSFDVIYEINNVIYKSEFEVSIIQSISYPLSQITVVYGKYYESAPINANIKNTNNLKFNINDSINGITINSNNGILYINSENIVPIGKYVINVNYNNTSTTITIIIIPELSYTSIINSINYQSNYLSQKPIINPNNGTFKIITNNDNITIDNDGIISCNNLDIGIYNFIIQYTVENQTSEKDNIFSETNYSIKCNPVINYNINALEIDYNKGGSSDIPNCLPLNGTFKLKNNILGVSIENNGTLNFDPTIFIGNYNIEVIYQVFNNIVTTNYNLLVKPVIVYNDDSFIYNSLIITNKPITDFNDGIFRLLNNSNNNITINKNTGILTLINTEPSKYKFEIEYTKNNISVITYYNVIIKPNIYYPSDNFSFIYNSNNTIIPILEPPNGIINISNTNNLNTSIINTSDLDINNYVYNVDYTYNNITTNKTLNVTIQSDLYYEFNEYVYKKTNIIYPKNYRGIGTFTSTNINTNINQDGSINITNLEIGNYSYIINHIVNDVITSINLEFIVKPEFYYDFSNLNLVYNTNDFKISSPYVSYKNNTSYFALDDENNYYLKINKNTGEIIVNTSLLIGHYNYVINYYVNNVKTSFLLNIHINPYISYNTTNILNNDGVIESLYKNNIKINKPKLNPDYGLIKCNNLPNNLIFNNGTINSTDYNNINSTDYNNINSTNGYVEVGEYTLEIEYTVDENTTIEYIRLLVYPEIKYINNNVINVYGTNYESELPIIVSGSSHGLFMLLDNNDNIIIDNTGKIYFDSSLDAKKYTVKVNYELNDVNVQTLYYINIVPIINASTLLFNLVFSENFIIDAPNVKPEGGKFRLENDYNNGSIILNPDGSIVLNNLYPGEYKIKLIYTYNELSCDVTYTVYIKPEISYELADNIIVFNSNTISNVPIVKPNIDRSLSKFKLINNIKYKIVNNNTQYKIDPMGKILFDSFLVGKHNIKVEYQYNNQTNFTNVEFEIIPKIYYSKTEYEMDHNTTIYSVIPQIEPKNINFITDLNINTNGQITFKDYDVGNYSFNIYYGSNFSKINLTVKPVFMYTTTIYEFSFNEQLIIYPINNNSGGIFYCSDNEININPENGFINLQNVYPCNKIITIFYKLNSVITQQNIKLICYPTINYSNTNSIIKYNEN